VETTSLVDLDAVEAAARRIAPAVRRTPLLATELGRPAAPLWLKAECLQVGGSFKIRGATNAVASLSAAERANGVITHSSGNHAQALARAARAVGTPAVVVMPEQAPPVKRRATAAQGAEVVLVDIADRVPAMERLQAERGAWFVPPFDDPAVIAGQGTVGLEIVEDLPDVSTVLCRSAVVGCSAGSPSRSRRAAAAPGWSGSSPSWPATPRTASPRASVGCGTAR
jgi:threonine dehydratase